MTEKNDILKDLFSRMPEEELPASFRANAMRQIMAEAERIRKRNERWGWIAVIAASLLMVGIAIASFLYMNISPISVQIPNMSTLPFYAYIGILALILLGADYKFRQLFKRRQMSQKEKDVSSGITSPKVCFFHAKSLASQKKALPLPRFLRDDNIMSNLLIKTNLSINN